MKRILIAGLIFLGVASLQVQITDVTATSFRMIDRVNQRLSSFPVDTATWKWEHQALGDSSEMMYVMFHDLIDDFGHDRIEVVRGEGLTVAVEAKDTPGGNFDIVLLGEMVEVTADVALALTADTVNFIYADVNGALQVVVDGWPGTAGEDTTTVRIAAVKTGVDTVEWTNIQYDVKSSWPRRVVNWSREVGEYQFHSGGEISAGGTDAKFEFGAGGTVNTLRSIHHEELHEFDDTTDFSWVDLVYPAGDGNTFDSDKYGNNQTLTNPLYLSKVLVCMVVNHESTKPQFVFIRDESQYANTGLATTAAWPAIPDRYANTLVKLVGITYRKGKDWSDVSSISDWIVTDFTVSGTAGGGGGGGGLSPHDVGGIVHDSTKTKADTAGWTASRVVETSATGILTASVVTATELGYIDGLASSAQDQLDFLIAVELTDSAAIGVLQALQQTDSARVAQEISDSLDAEFGTDRENGNYTITGTLGVGTTDLATPGSVFHTAPTGSGTNVPVTYWRQKNDADYGLVWSVDNAVSGQWMLRRWALGSEAQHYLTLLSNGQIAFDSTTLFIDRITNRVGVTTATPRTEIDMGPSGGLHFESGLAADSLWSGIVNTQVVDENSYALGGALHMDSDGHYVDADANVGALMPVSAIGLVTGTGSVLVLTYGYIREDEWNWTPGDIIYMSDTPGLIANSAGTVEQALGIAITADVVHFNIQDIDD